MWTYRHPYREPLTASERIQYHAHAELFRAMNIGRQIAFVGSGVSMAYGHPTWNEMVLLVVNAVDQRYRQKLVPKGGKIREWKPKNSSADRLHSSLREQFKKPSLHDVSFKKEDSKGTYYRYEPLNIPYSDKQFDSTTLLALCTDLSKAMGEEHFVRTFIANLFRASPLKLFFYRLFLLGGTDEYTLLQLFNMSLPNSMRVVEFNEATLTEIIDQFETAFLTTDRIETSIENLKENAPEIFQMGHLELEIHIWEKFKTACSDLNRCSKTFPEETVLSILGILACFDQIMDKSAGPDPIKILVEDWGIKRFVTTNYDLEIENHFINSQFFSPQSGHEHAFKKSKNSNINPLVAENGYGGQLISSSISSHNIGDLTDFSVLTIRDNIQVLHIHGRLDQPDDLVITEYDYQNLYLKNHVTRRTFDESVRTLFAGNDVVFVGLGMSEPDVLRPMREFMSDGQNTAKHREGVVSLLNQKVDEKSKAQSLTISLKTQYDINSVLYENESKSPSYPEEESISRTTLVQYIIESREHALQSTIEFEKALKKLAIQQKRWWQDLILAPDSGISDTESQNRRYAIYQCEYILSKTSTFTQNTAKQDPGHMVKWSRRTLIKPDIFKKVEPSDQENASVRYIKDQISNTLTLQKLRGRRAIIVAGDSGVGKGTFVSSLQENHLGLFNNNGFPTIHAFHSDPRYISDFNSVISALTRFVAGRLRSLQIQKQFPNKKKFASEDQDHIRQAEQFIFNNNTSRELLELEDFDDHPLGRLKLLEKLLLKFGKLAHRSKHRLFVCLSYLDHLSDEKGWEYNKLHRRFIQLLTSESLQDVPLDIVFVTSTSKPLIMSLQQANSIPPNHRFLLKRLSFTDRHWLYFPFFTEGKRITDIDEVVAIGKAANTRYLKEMAKESLSIHMVLRSLVYNFVHAGATEAKSLKDVSEERLQALQQTFSKLDFYASQKNVQKVLATILTAYECLDTKFYNVRNRPPIFRAILRRLAFFSNPVERNVIASCPDIVDIYRKFAPIVEGDPDFTEKDIAIWLEGYLSILHSRGLLIKTLGGRIQKSTHTSNIQPSPENDRYVIHSLLRNHLEKKMDYSIFESGEHSFYDVSLYMTQPR
ncbi:MAG: SIR2 family protein, partial [Sneathiella sp.]